MTFKTYYIGIKGLVIRENKVLVLKAIDDRGIAYWDLPGGRMDESEDIHQTLTRELKEELPNIENVEILNLVQAFKLPRNLQNGLGLMLLFYMVKADIEAEVVLSEEHTGYKWVGKEDVDALGLNDGACIEDGHKNALRLAFKNKDLIV